MGPVEDVGEQILVLRSFLAGLRGDGCVAIREGDGRNGGVGLVRNGKGVAGVAGTELEDAVVAESEAIELVAADGPVMIQTRCGWAEKLLIDGGQRLGQAGRRELIAGKCGSESRCRADADCR